MARDPRAKKHARTVEVDERWIADWLRLGQIELDSFLARHAAFEAYYQQRMEAPSGSEPDPRRVREQ